MAISTSTFLSDVVIFIRNLLRTNVTDPIGRTNGVGFVMTAFPKRQTQYPLITVKSIGLDSKKLGMSSEANMVSIELETRVWARNSKECDTLTQKVINTLRSNQYGTNSTDVEEIHGFELLSSTPVTEEEGDNTIHSNVLTFAYKVILSWFII